MMNYLKVLYKLKQLYIIRLGGILCKRKDWWWEPNSIDSLFYLEERYENTLLDLVELFNEE